MTDDEAFIRAVVASPGDDTPRLVYADWLDERDDPRGAYLRAEAEAVASDDIGGLAALRRAAFAADTDPLWLSRVSRPPAGACCDHIRFAESGPRLSAGNIDACQGRLDTTFPPDVVAFLLNYNGGRPDPGRYNPDVPDARRGSRRVDLAIDWFLPAAGTTHPREDIESFMPVLHNSRVKSHRQTNLWADGVRDYVPIATQHGLGVVAVGLRGRRAGAVYHINHMILASSSPPRKVADSICNFLYWVRTPLESP